MAGWQWSHSISVNLINRHFNIELETTSKAWELHRKRVASAFWNLEVEAEIREQNNLVHTFDGAGARDQYMDQVDDMRARSVYPHTECSDECKKRGMY